jgi:hypothetical protein
MMVIMASWLVSLTLALPSPEYFEASIDVLDLSHPNLIELKFHWEFLLKHYE